MDTEIRLISLIQETINLMDIWGENQNFSAGELVLMILPSEPNASIGKAKLPTPETGKVVKKQKVNVRINNFPHQEFGHLTGKVKSISNIPTEEEFYIVEIGFPEGLSTHYGPYLSINQQMVRQADIIIIQDNG